MGIPQPVIPRIWKEGEKPDLSYVHTKECDRLKFAADDCPCGLVKRLSERKIPEDYKPQYVAERVVTNCPLSSDEDMKEFLRLLVVRTAALDVKKCLEG